MYYILYTTICYCIVYTTYYILHTMYYVLYNIYCILCIIYYILHTVYFILYPVYYILHTIYYVLRVTIYIHDVLLCFRTFGIIPKIHNYSGRRCLSSFASKQRSSPADMKFSNVLWACLNLDTFELFDIWGLAEICSIYSANFQGLPCFHNLVEI